MNQKIHTLVLNALHEDIGPGDVTLKALVKEKRVVQAVIISIEPGIIAGLDVAQLVFTTIDSSILFKKTALEGAAVKAGKIIAQIRGDARAILLGERTALNFLQRLSGIATLTNRYVNAAGRIKVLDTRKTTPGLRVLEKYAVKVGGGKNHRFGLSDMVLVKDNYLKKGQSIAEAIGMARKQYGNRYRIEAEVKTLEELVQALQANPDIIMLDNMSFASIRKALSLIHQSKKRIKVEVSGGITPEKLKELSKLSIDYVSAGAITNSARALDMSLKIK